MLSRTALRICGGANKRCHLSGSTRPWLLRAGRNDGLHSISNALLTRISSSGSLLSASASASASASSLFYFSSSTAETTSAWRPSSNNHHATSRDDPPSSSSRKQQQQQQQQQHSVTGGPSLSLSPSGSSHSSSTSLACYSMPAWQRLMPPLPGSSQPLGDPLPTDEHACSASLPTWSAVVGYEEGNPNVTKAMKCGYPRFVYHPYVIQLMEYALQHYSIQRTEPPSPLPQQSQQQQQPAQASSSTPQHNYEEDCLILPSAESAARCQAFLQQAVENDSTVVDNAWIELYAPSRTGDNDNVASRSPSSSLLPQPFRSAPSLNSRVRVVPLLASDVHAVLFPAITLAGTQAKAYWQHTGELVSSRRAESALRQLGVPLQRQVTSGPNAPYICHPASMTTTAESESSTTPSEQDAGTTVPATTRTATTIAPAAAAASSPVCDQLRSRIADLAQVPSKECVFLTPSGMNSIYVALRSARRRLQLRGAQKANSGLGGRGGTAIVYGFPYLDTLKLCSRPELCPDGVEFFGHGNESDLKALESMLQRSQLQGPRRQFCALFTEVPSNPLLQCPDLVRLRQLADQYDFCLIVDDTISNFLNADLLNSGLADAVCTSLTKLVSGRGDAMGGSIVANPNTEKGRWIHHDLSQRVDPAGGLYEADARALLMNSQDFEQRNEFINRTSQTLAQWLHTHPDVDTVYYPQLSSPLYEQQVLRKPDSHGVASSGGYGGLMSIILHPHMCQRTFYDALDIAKGPSLGTNFTLACPYTLLAHYHELDFAMSYNVPPNLIRVSIGLEPVEVLQSKFEQAFATSKLHPKVRSTGHRVRPQ